MTVQEMSDLLKSTIGEHLGQYRLPNGSLVPSFSVLALDEQRQTNKQPIGLECILLEHPRRRPYGFCGGELNERNLWSAYLVQWPDLADPYGGKSNLAIAALEAHFFSNIQISAVPSAGPALSQQACLIKDEAYVELID